MYIYLSDRKRRLYLSQASPQNLSPKRNISRKDRRFLQKNVANIQDSLSARLVKQQKVLYCKHIGSLIEPSIFLTKTDTLQPAQPAFAEQKSRLSSKTLIGLQESNEREIIPAFYLQVWEKQLNVYRTHALTVTCACSFLTVKTAELPLEKQQGQAVCKAQAKQKQQKKPTNVYAFSALSVYVQPIKTSAENTFTDIQKNTPLYVKKKMSTPIEGFAGTAAFPSFNKKENSALVPLLCKASKAMHLQSYNKQNLQGKVKPAACFAPFAEQSKQAAKALAKQNKESVLKSCLHMPFLAFSICRTLTSPPLYANGKSLYFYSRYLYNIESLKTCIMPQVLQNQKTASRYKYILHERKKLALLYGQLAKKDMQTLIKSATALPGLFEDNVFALLESRVDVLVHRAGFSNSIAGARQLIRNGMFYINGKKICSCKTRAFPGDFLAVCSAKLTKREGLLYKVYMHTTEQLFNLYTESNPLTKASFLNYKAMHNKTAEVAEVANQVLALRSTCLPSTASSKQSKPKIDSKKKPTFSQSLFLYRNLCKKESLPWFCSLQRNSASFAICKARAAKVVSEKEAKQENEIYTKAQQKKTDLPLQKQHNKQDFGLSSLQSRTSKSNKAKVLFSTEKSYKISAHETFPDRGRETNQRTALVARISAFTKGTGLFSQASTCLLTCSAKVVAEQVAKASALLAEQSTCLCVRSNATSCIATHAKASNKQNKAKGKAKPHFNTEKNGLWCSRLLNSCGAHILKYKAKQRQFFMAEVEKEVVFHRFMKNIQNANSASIWGQKPLHLEISHKRGAFIYMYKPQKIIFPVSLDLHAIKGSI